MKISRIILLLTTLIITGFLFLLVLFLKQQKTTQPPLSEKTQQKLSVISYSPKNINIEYLPIQQVSITFNQSISINSVKVSTFPQTETLIRQGSDAATIIISAKPAWKNGTTKIEVSYENGLLQPVFVYPLKTGFPPVPPPDGKGY